MIMRFMMLLSIELKDDHFFNDHIRLGCNCNDVNRSHAMDCAKFTSLSGTKGRLQRLIGQKSWPAGVKLPHGSSLCRELFIFQCKETSYDS